MDLLLENKSPIIKGEEVTFIYKGSAKSVFLVSDCNKWELEDKMTRIENTDTWYITKQFPENARLDYKYVVDDNWIRDPLNEFATNGGLSDNSTLIMPKYQSDYDKIINENVPRGNLIKDLKYYSNYLNAEMNYHVYLPANYKKENASCVLYALDGSDYVNFAKINLILDYMIYKNEIPNMVAILVDPKDRDRDYTIFHPYFNYFINELMPYVEGQYCKINPERTIAGVSWGALTSIYLAVNSPSTFKNVLSQSGSFWPRDYSIYDIVDVVVNPQTKFYLQTGTIHDTEKMNDTMVDILKSKNAFVEHTKFAESHSWGNWRGHFNEILKRVTL